MEGLFFKVLGMSATAAVVILAVLLARLLLRRAPKVFSYALWAVALLRLLCPFTLDSAFSLLPAAQVEDVPGLGDTPAQVIQVQTGITTVDRQVNDFFLHHPYQGLPDLPEYAELPPQEPGPAPDWRTVPATVWLAGAAALLGYGLISLLALRRKLVGWVPLEGEKNVRLADHIPSPFVLGLFRPKIYLPSGLPEGERDYVLLHERTHIRRCDHIFRALAWLALAIHWFNPLVWLAFRLAGRDMEMSCDEAVLRKMGRDVRADYSTSLLRLSAGKRLPAGPLAFGGGDPKGRINNVLRWKKPALWVTAAALIAVVCIGAALATDRGAAPDSSEPDSELTFALERAGEGHPYYVRIGGTALGHTLGENTIWRPSLGAEEEYAGYRGLTMEYTFESGSGRVYAWWADEGRTRVTVSTEASTIGISSIVNWWEFTVELSGEQGTVTSMETRCREGEPSDRLRTMPEAVSDEETVMVARIAAKLLTAAEDYYNNAQHGGLSLAYVLDEGNGSGDVRIIGLVDGYASWSADTSPSGGNLYFAGTPATCCPRLAGRGIEGSAIWTDETHTAVSVVMNVDDDRVVSGTVSGFYIHFVVDLTDMTAIRSEFESEIEGETLELNDQEMADMARVLAQALEGAEDYYSNGVAMSGDAPGSSPPERVWAWGSAEDTPDKADWDMEEWARDNGVSYRFSRQDIDSAIEAARAYLEEEWAKEEWVISFEVTDVYEARMETLRHWFMYFDRVSAAFTDWTQEDMETRYIVIGADYTCEYDHTLTPMFDGEQRTSIVLTRPTAEGEWSVHDAYSLPVLDRIVNHWGGNPGSPAPGDVWMEVAPGTVTPTGLTYQIHNESQGKLMYGNPFGLQAEDGGIWHRVRGQDTVVFTLEGYMLDGNASASKTIDWGYAYGELPPGHYRITTEVRLEQERKTITLSAEFEIEA